MRDKYLPLTAFTYGELDTGDYAKLTACTNCIPVKRRAEIDEINQERIELGEMLKNPVYTGGATHRRRHTARRCLGYRHGSVRRRDHHHPVTGQAPPRVLIGHGAVLLWGFLCQHPFDEQAIAHGGIIDEHISASMMPAGNHPFGSRG